jgi:NTE family protein
MGAIRTLVLSGGGGRGAFHAGVYQYLSEINKPGVDHEHQGAWAPDIVVGTSIGAVNGAAIVQGMPAEELATCWKTLRERDIEGLPPGMSWITRWVINGVMRNLIGVRLPSIPADQATSLPPSSSWNLLPGSGKLLSWLLGRWSNLLDTGPLRKTMQTKLKLDEKKIHQSRQTLLINATNVSTGERVTFSNKPVYHRGRDELRADVVHGISLNRIIASCSIPMVYPWTFDIGTAAYYWDGAVVDNTPIGVALDAARDFALDDEMEIVVVMMTPWREQGASQDSIRPPLPNNFGESITWALDWLLLASFRERLNLIQAYNHLGRVGRAIGDPVLSAYRSIKVTIVAPDDFFPAVQIIDYDQRIGGLINMGYQAAEKAFRRDYGVR